MVDELETEIQSLQERNKVLTEALKAYAVKSEWSGEPWKLRFNSSYRDGHGYEIAEKALKDKA